VKSTIRNLSMLGVVGVAGVAAVVMFTDGGSRSSPPVVAAESNVLQSVLDLRDVSPESAAASESASASSDVVELPDRGSSPPLVNIESWLQSDVTSLEELEGQVVAVQFWTLGCNNWQATLPAMQDLYDNYQDQGLEIVGIHSAEFSYEAELENVVDALDRYDIDWPIALDPTKRTFHSWQEGKTGYWPRIYLIDRAGNIRYDHHGEGRYDEIDVAVQELLAEPA
jgi:thiol-disulfide isomerase/thioredoxin